MRILGICALAVLVLVGASAVVGAGLVSSTNGGGTIPSPLGGNAHFSLSVRLDDEGHISGHLSYIDTALDFSIHSTSITAYVPSGNEATFLGQDESASAVFEVTVTDGGNPGTSDTFTIAISGPTVPSGFYANAGTLSSGNIHVRE
jgi:hypothetical protein